MSEFVFKIIFPIWIGIIGNLLMTWFHIENMGKTFGPFRRWYFDGHGAEWVMGIMWAALLTWSAINALEGWSQGVLGK